MRTFIAALLFLIGNVHAQAQTNWDYLSETPERLIGILDLPETIAYGCGPAPQRATVRAFATPSQSGRAVGTISWHEVPNVECWLMMQKADGSKERVPTLESGYEIPAAIVFERRGAWYRIRLTTGSVWIQHDDPEDFLPYPDVLRKGSHTLQTWDGILRAKPGSSGRVVPLSEGWKVLLDRQLQIEYLGSQLVGKDLWLHIRLAATARCGQTYPDVTDVEGWIPAYHADRTTMAWFASRGC